MRHLRPLPRISDEQREGVRKLLNWCVHRYENCSGVNAKRMWKGRIDFLAELQRKQSYTEEDKEQFNKIREKYFKYKLGQPCL